MTASFKDLNQLGYQLRENEGKPEEALKVLRQALEVAGNLEQRAEAMAQIGLTHWHTENYDKAREVWAETLSICEEGGQLGPLALAYRNMGRPEITPNWEKQFEYMEKSYRLAKQAGREDVVWFAHGVTSAAVKAGQMEVAAEWLQIEFAELNQHLSGAIQVPNANNVHIWHTGYLMNAAFVENDRLKLEEAMKLAEEAQLPKRIEQIKASMEEFDSR